MAKFASVSASEVARSGRMDAGFHILSQAHQDRVQQLQAQMDAQGAVEQVRAFPPALVVRACQDLGAGQYRANWQILAQACKHPHLALALIEQALPAEIQAQSAAEAASIEKRQALEQLQARVFAAKPARAKGPSP